MAICQKDLIILSENGEWEVSRKTLEISHKIGHGCFGSVHLAHWRFTPVVVKILVKSSENICLQEFRSELDSLSQIRHPNIIQFFGACTHQKPFIILLEYMTNGNLDAHIHHMSFEHKKCILNDITNGLSYLHNRQPRCVIHRDLKPTNILLNENFRAKIADFGLSVFQQNHNDSFLMTGETGTYRYMAPEVIMHKEYNSSVDIWSFGMIMYYMFYHMPFENLTTTSIISSVTSPYYKLHFSKTTELSNIISKCTDWIPTNRPQSLNLHFLLENIQPMKRNFGLFRCFHLKDNKHIS